MSCCFIWSIEANVTPLGAIDDVYRPSAAQADCDCLRPLFLGKVAPNGYDGFRTAKTMSSPKI